MKRLLLLLSLFLGCVVHLSAASGDNADWYLYVWSDTQNSGGDLGQFVETDTEGVFVLKGVTTTEAGLKYCIHDNSWSVKYGWSKDQEGSVGATGIDVPLGLASGANGWLGLAADTYDVTFNINGPSVRFDLQATGEDDDEEETPLSDRLRGGDISMLNYVEDMGAKFYTTEGVEADPLEIMRLAGMNIVRLRLYNNPGESVTYSGNTYRLPAGYLDEADVLKLAKRAKDKGFKIELTFHYSDFWTNGEMQFKPKGWKNHTMAQLKTAVYDYTKAFLQRMNEQGTTPEFVSIGNEIQSGLLFGHASSKDAVHGYADKNNIANVAALLAEGSKAVREACPQSKIVIHLTLSEAITTNNYTWFFTNMKNNSLDYDIIGASYYPYWTNQRPSMLTALANSMWNSFGKNVLIMEVGYSWTAYRPSGRYNGNYEGQLHMNGSPYNEASQKGQKAFMKELQAVIDANEHLLGYLYWDPVMVEQKVNNKWIETCWAQRYDSSASKWYQDGNVVGNTTWFDYEGKALPLLKARQDMMQNVEAVHGDATNRDSAVYDLLGRRVKNPTHGIFISNGKKIVK